MVLCLTFILLSQTGTQACTGLQFKTEDGTFVSGRILESGILFETSVIAVPQGHTFTNQTIRMVDLPKFASRRQIDQKNTKIRQPIVGMTGNLNKRKNTFHFWKNQAEAEQAFPPASGSVLGNMDS